ncbi:uncharacterized protein TNCT_530681 [Trichonephila clavata]|uniref:Uncharacterized protein n=1 Tax=Trichonephila clavata TaxID=2740835 RepID=A0A8X6H3F5_TRICU|nr:uncharacterized protein TNCT_530681 [Trichonephila clavata]
MATSDIERNTATSESGEKEDLMNLVGGDGPWQRWIFVVVVLCSIPDGCHNMAMSFYAPNIDHWCARPTDLNLSVQEWKDAALPPDDQHCSRTGRILPKEPITVLKKIKFNDDYLP